MTGVNSEEGGGCGLQESGRKNIKQCSYDQGFSREARKNITAPLRWKSSSNHRRALCTNHQEVESYCATLKRVRVRFWPYRNGPVPLPDSGLFL